jgi:hypothetical protein
MKLSEEIFTSTLMQSLLGDLSEEEAEDLKKYIEEFSEPVESLAFLIKDIMAVESTREKFAEDIINLFTPENIKKSMMGDEDG